VHVCWGIAVGSQRVLLTACVHMSVYFRISRTAGVTAVCRLKFSKQAAPAEVLLVGGMGDG